jgi:hypothetical protein
VPGNSNSDASDATARRETGAANKNCDIIDAGSLLMPPQTGTLEQHGYGWGGAGYE